MKQKLRELIKNKKGAALLVSTALIMLVGVQATVAYLIAGTPSYVNTFKPATYKQGTLSILKTVQHPLGADYEYPENIEFDFDIQLEYLQMEASHLNANMQEDATTGGAYGLEDEDDSMFDEMVEELSTGSSYAFCTFQLDRIMGDNITPDEATADEDGVLQLTLKPGEQIDIKGIDEHTLVTVTETSLLPGFHVMDDKYTQTAEIMADGDMIEFINIYSPDSATGETIRVTAEKLLQGRDWQSDDAFTVQMQYDQGNGTWIEYGERIIDYNVYKDSAASVDFDDIIYDMEFDKPGEYGFRISEAVPENPLRYMTYDDTVYEFYVTVGDADMDGFLEVQEVAAAGEDDTFVKEDDGEYLVDMRFTNIYDKPGDTPDDPNDPDDPDDPDTPDDPEDPDDPDKPEDDKDTPQGGKVPAALNGDDHIAYVFGYPDGTVRPEREITRAEVATIFYRLLKDDVRERYCTDTCSFSDVKRGAWYDTEVATMANMGIIGGYPDGTFKPDAPITRAEFTAMASRFDTQGVTDEVIFKDVEGHWAELAIELSANNKWVMGYEDGTFRPDRNISRAEAMAIMNRILCRQPETVDDLHPDMIHWPDNADTGMWYYVTVQEATNGHEYEWKDEQYETWTELKNTKEKESFLDRFLRFFKL